LFFGRAQKLLNALLISHLPAGRQGFQKMITEISMISQEVSGSPEKSLITQIIVNGANKLTSPFVITNEVKQSQGIATSLHSSQ